MWIVGQDMTYYPKIYKFEKEEDAIDKYNNLKNDVENGEYPEDRNQCIFIAEVNKYTKGNEYKMNDSKTNKEI